MKTLILSILILIFFSGCFGVKQHKKEDVVVKEKKIRFHIEIRKSFGDGDSYFFERECDSFKIYKDKGYFVTYSYDDSVIYLSGINEISTIWRIR